MKPLDEADVKMLDELDRLQRAAARAEGHSLPPACGAATRASGKRLSASQR